MDAEAAGGLRDAAARARDRQDRVADGADGGIWRGEFAELEGDETPGASESAESRSTVRRGVRDARCGAAGERCDAARPMRSSWLVRKPSMPMPTEPMPTETWGAAARRAASTAS